MIESKPLHVILGAGHIAMLLADRLLAAGFRVRLVRRGPPGETRENLSWARGHLRDRSLAEEATRGAAVVYQCSAPPYEKWHDELAALWRGGLHGASKAAARYVVLDTCICTASRLGRLTRTRRSGPSVARVSFGREHYDVDKPSTSIFSGTATLKPDPLNYGWRDYAVRVGIWRMIEALDKYKMRASVLLNSDCCRHYPQIIDAGKERNWAWIAHGKNKSIFQADMTVEQERSYLTEVVKTPMQPGTRSRAGSVRLSQKHSKLQKFSRNSAFPMCLTGVSMISLFHLIFRV
jgi:hypothetical protein